MRILLLSLVFSPDSDSTAVLMTELAMALKKQGHEIVVLTTTPHNNVEPEARQRQPLTSRWGDLLYQSNCEGMPVYHTRIPAKGSRLVTRIFSYLRFHAISTMAGLTILPKYDLILVPSPPLTIGLSAWILGLIRRAPFVYNVQEIYPDVAVSLGVLKNRTTIRVLEQLEQFIYARSEHVTVISEWFRQQLLHKGVPADKMSVIPNFVDTDFITPSSKENPFAVEHNLTDQFVVLYAGNIGLTQSFETILETVRMLTHLPELQVVIIGGGTRRAWLEGQLAQFPLPNVKLLPYQPRSMVPQVYASSDLCLVPLKKGTAKDTFPSKIYTIMAAGRAVIASADANSELTWVVEETQCGWAVPPDDAPKLVEAIEQAYWQRDALAQKGQNGRNYVTTYHSQQTVAHLYDALIKEISKGISQS